jgi:cold shock CspA family protein/ribosome-associated translation inhibitor RaiA
METSGLQARQIRVSGEFAMDSPLEIAFHNTDPSPALETAIRERVAKLEKLCDRLVACRVSVEKLHRQHRTGNVYEVHITLQLPGRDLAVSREPHRAKQRYANPDVHTSLRDAFDAAEAQLLSFKEQQRGEVKPHEVPLRGQVSQLRPAEDHGFILTNTGTQLYFHRNSVMNAGFDKLRRGEAVHYVEATGDTGPTASKVWVASEVEPA